MQMSALFSLIFSGFQNSANGGLVDAETARNGGLRFGFGFLHNNAALSFGEFGFVHNLGGPNRDDQQRNKDSESHVDNDRG
jgi:hypothetical protein